MQRKCILCAHLAVIWQGEHLELKTNWVLEDQGVIWRARGDVPRSPCHWWIMTHLTGSVQQPHNMRFGWSLSLAGASCGHVLLEKMDGGWFSDSDGLWNAACHFCCFAFLALLLSCIQVPVSFLALRRSYKLGLVHSLDLVKIEVYSHLFMFIWMTSRGVCADFNLHFLRTWFALGVKTHISDSLNQGRKTWESAQVDHLRPQLEQFLLSSRGTSEDWDRMR